MVVVLVERALSWGWLGILPGAGGGPPREGLALVVTWSQASGVDVTRSLVRFQMPAYAHGRWVLRRPRKDDSSSRLILWGRGVWRRLRQDDSLSQLIFRNIVKYSGSSDRDTYYSDSHQSNTCDSDSSDIDIRESDSCNSYKSDIYYVNCIGFQTIY